ncbi:MAG: DUF4157 domain-containing protein [bacterium]
MKERESANKSEKEKKSQFYQYNAVKRRSELNSPKNNVSLINQNRENSTNSLLSVQNTHDFLSFLNISQEENILNHLHQNYGNAFLQRTIQAKLKISNPRDIYEREADKVADEVVNIPEPQIQKQTEKKDNLINKKNNSDCTIPINKNKQSIGQSLSPISLIESRNHDLKNSGQPLSKSISNFFETRFGYDFSGVRIHTSTRTAEMADALNSRAFTVGNDVVFGAGQYVPNTSSGKRLLAHELTHCIQQANTNYKRYKPHSNNSMNSLRHLKPKYSGLMIQRQETEATTCKEDESSKKYLEYVKKMIGKDAWENLVKKSKKKPLDQHAIVVEFLSLLRPKTQHYVAEKEKPGLKEDEGIFLGGCFEFSMLIVSGVCALGISAELHDTNTEFNSPMDVEEFRRKYPKCSYTPGHFFPFMPTLGLGLVDGDDIHSDTPISSLLIDWSSIERRWRKSVEGRKERWQKIVKTPSTEQEEEKRLDYINLWESELKQLHITFPPEEKKSGEKEETKPGEIGERKKKSFTVTFYKVLLKVPAKVVLHQRSVSKVFPTQWFSVFTDKRFPFFKLRTFIESEKECDKERAKAYLPKELHNPVRLPETEEQALEILANCFVAIAMLKPYYP